MAPQQEPASYAAKMLEVLKARKKQDAALMEKLKPIKEKKSKKKKAKGFRIVTAIKLLPGDTLIRDVNLVQVKIKNE
jgi:hypothetical protein